MLHFRKYDIISYALPCGMPGGEVGREVPPGALRDAAAITGPRSWSANRIIRTKKNQREAE